MGGRRIKIEGGLADSGGGQRGGRGSGARLNINPSRALLAKIFSDSATPSLKKKLRIRQFRTLYISQWSHYWLFCQLRDCTGKKIFTRPSKT